MLDIKHSFHEYDVVTVVLSGAFEEREWEIKERTGSLVFEEFQKQVTKVLYDARNDVPLIREHYYDFDKCGVFPYSKTVDSALDHLIQFRIVTRIMGTLEEIVKPEVLEFAKGVLKAELITEKDYNVLQDLGKKLEVKREVYI